MKLKNKFPLIAKCLLLICFVLIIPALFSSAANLNKKNSHGLNITSFYAPVALGLYSILSLDSLGLSEEAFNEAVTGFLNLQRLGTIQNKAVLSIVDFSLPSYKKRLFVLDMENGRLLFN